MGKLPIFDDAALRRLTMPVLVVGRRDRMLESAATQRRVAQVARHASVIALPGVRHLLPRQTKAVFEFLRAKGKAND
jgi:pimeloyl-ACP methyl ester carboxylesterase